MPRAPECNTCCYAMGITAALLTGSYLSPLAAKVVAGLTVAGVYGANKLAGKCYPTREEQTRVQPVIAEQPHAGDQNVLNTPPYVAQPPRAPEIVQLHASEGARREEDAVIYDRRTPDSPPPAYLFQAQDAENAVNGHRQQADQTRV